MPVAVNQKPRQTPYRKYRYVVLPIIPIFKAEKPTDDDSLLDRAVVQGKYIIQPFKSDSGKSELRNIPVILKPEGTIWHHGSLYLLSRASEYNPPSDQTLRSTAKALVDYINTLTADQVDYLSTPLRKSLRPTYHYRAELEERINGNLLAISTANSRISAVVNFYRWMKDRFDYHPTQDLWIDEKRYIRYSNRQGFSSGKEVITTNLHIKQSEQVNTGEYIVDGGKLYPYCEEQQRALIKVMFEIQNTEMILSFLVALTSGARSLATYTLRISDIVNPEAVKGTEVSIRIGRQTAVNNKDNKVMNIYIPSWLNRLIYIYINSERYQRRSRKAEQPSDGAQYLFLTSRGNPFHISKNDMRRGQGSPIQDGNSVRKYISETLQPALNKLDSPFKFRFHNLRACFGMNLLEEKIKGLPVNSVAYSRALGKVQQRMGHANRTTTERYLNYRENKELTFQAQSMFEQHLQDIAENYVYS
ncbi:site-specific integrase [Pseudomonas coronafaciens]|uniref:Integrase protein n=1 Tax=Pseudomonas coronafaciens pv. striafaciens TaxID=235276 RepID=A0A3M4YC75_9PSED|nr:site-specific integrase [Pseudomonas coronafaciens]RMR86305.1 Integrase protein [Pseudomonas coronafaciens pv. striafaciens]